jgi:acid phosphatase type 7
MARLAMPKVATQLWYGLQLGPIHFLMLSSYSDYSNTGPQYAWLTAELAAIDRSVTPWVIAVLHAPWYNSNTAHQGEGEAMRQSMETMLYKANVDLVLAGHVHAYERCYRSYNFQRDPNGPYYITIGDGGNREGLATKWESPQPVWSAFRQASYGHGELQVFNATHM